MCLVSNSKLRSVLSLKLHHQSIYLSPNVNKYSNSIYLSHANNCNKLLAGLLDSCLPTLKSNFHVTHRVVFLKHLPNSRPGGSYLRSGSADLTSCIVPRYPLARCASVRLSVTQLRLGVLSDSAAFVFPSLQPAPITHPQYISLLESF